MSNKLKIFALAGLALFTVQFTVLFSAQFANAEGVERESKIMRSVWYYDWLVGFGDISTPKSCDDWQLYRLQTQAERAAFDACQEEGLEDCRVLGSKIVVNGRLTDEIRFEWGLTTCNPSKMSCSGGGSLANHHGCIVRGSAKGTL